jgi:hypothetical protein
MAALNKSDNLVNQSPNASNPQIVDINQNKQTPFSNPNQSRQNLDFGKRSATGRIIATIFSMLLLLGGIAAGVLLVQQQQELREQAAGFNECVKSALCELIDEPEQSGVYEAKSDIKYILITTKEILRFESGITDNGCYRITISRNVLMWSTYGKGTGCRFPVNIQIWLSDTN